MDGVFAKWRFARVYNIIGLISGVFLVLFFGFFICAGEFSTLDDMIFSCFFVCFGLFVSILCGFSLYVNRKACIHVDDRKISAYCHFGLRLECDLSEVKNISYGGFTLNIQLKNGRKYNLINLENACQIGKYIQKRLSPEPAMYHGKEELMAAVPLLKRKRKREGIASIVCFLLIFPGIILTAALTDWKDLHEFSANDWTVFLIMLGAGVVVIALFSILLRRYLLDTDELNKMQGTLYQTILYTAPLQSGNAIKAFVDDDTCPSVRLTIFGYPNSDEVYVTVEQVNQKFEIECIYTSGVYANINEIASKIEDMTEIALP